MIFDDDYRYWTSVSIDVFSCIAMENATLSDSTYLQERNAVSPLAIGTQCLFSLLGLLIWFCLALYLFQAKMVQEFITLIYNILI